MPKICLMNYKVITIPKFEQSLKRLVKKYPSLKYEYIELVESLRIKPEQGTFLGNHCYKIRLAIASKGKGKSGGARIITYVHIVESTVYLLFIFDKSERENISDTDLTELVGMI